MENAILIVLFVILVLLCGYECYLHIKFMRFCKKYNSENYSYNEDNKKYSRFDGRYPDDLL